MVTWWEGANPCGKFDEFIWGIWNRVTSIESFSSDRNVCLLWLFASCLWGCGITLPFWAFWSCLLRQPRIISGRLNDSVNAIHRLSVIAAFVLGIIHKCISTFNLGRQSQALISIKVYNSVRAIYRFFLPRRIVWRDFIFRRFDTQGLRSVDGAINTFYREVWFWGLTRRRNVVVTGWRRRNSRWNRVRVTVMRSYKIQKLDSNVFQLCKPLKSFTRTPI